MAEMRITVAGLGYVGVVTAACLADRGHVVTGIDVSEDKVALVNAGVSPIVESEIGDLVATAVSSGMLRASTHLEDGIVDAEVVMVCVGTPSAPHGAVATDHVARVSREIGTAMRATGHRPLVVIRSTMLPGTCENVVVPCLEGASGLVAGVDFHVCVHPEFLREGSSVTDFLDPPKTVIGSEEGDAVAPLLDLYAGATGPVFLTSVRTAEMIKYVDNSFHALKVCFANEIAVLAKHAGVEVDVLMGAFTADTTLNISPAYLTPGFSFGGSCLPKDVRALVHLARHNDVGVPLLEQILPSNDEHTRRAYELINATGSRRIGLFGLAFKPGTDDLRESPMVRLAETLLGKGFEILIHDENVIAAQLLGANRAYVDAHVPHLSRLLRNDVDEILDNVDVCVLGTSSPLTVDAVKRTDRHIVIDLVGRPTADRDDRYRALCW